MPGNTGVWWPRYFEEFDVSKKVRRAEVDDPEKYCTLLLRHMGGFIDKYRPELPFNLISDFTAHP